MGFAADGLRESSPGLQSWNKGRWLSGSLLLFVVGLLWRQSQMTPRVTSHLIIFQGGGWTVGSCPQTLTVMTKSSSRRRRAVLPPAASDPPEGLRPPHPSSFLRTELSPGRRCRRSCAGHNTTLGPRCVPPRGVSATPPPPPFRGDGVLGAGEDVGCCWCACSLSRLPNNPSYPSPRPTTGLSNHHHPPVRCDM